MRSLLFTALLATSAFAALPPRAPAPQAANFNAKASLSVDKTSLTLTSAVAVREFRKYPAGYSWLRIHFYSFPLTATDLVAARSGNVDLIDKKSNKNSSDPKVGSASFGVIQLSLDEKLAVSQVDMSIPGHSCTIAPFDKDVRAFLETYRFDGKTLRLKSKGSYTCDLKAVGAGEKTYTWDIDVSLPVFDKPGPAK
jgi:hypothetical protein